MVSMKLPNVVCGSDDGKSRMSVQRYRAMAASLLHKETAKKRSHSMSQDEGNDQSKGSSKSDNSPESRKFGCKRQRVALATEQETCSRDGLIASSHLRGSLVKDVNTQESSRSEKVGGSPVSDKKEEGKLCGKKDGVQGSRQAPLTGSNNLRLVEYWVPVQLSNAQLEQYFLTLIENSELLCSSSKRGSLEPLQDVLVALKKCCDHPYVLDASLQSSFKDLRSPSCDYLSIAIETSGKLQLLSKFLAKIREQGLSVLIVYKTISSSAQNGFGIGYILDDFIYQSFGKESYAHIFTQSCVHPREKQAAVDLSNDRTGGRFIILTEYSSSAVNIKLSSADVVILFNGDWNPANDIRALEKMKLHTESGKLKVFRLYSSYTLEEKVLCLARDGAAANSNMRSLNWSACHSLLAWGAAYLHDRLDILHVTAAFESTKSLEDDFACSILHELSNLLTSKADDSDSCSIISRAYWFDEMYCGNIKLHGEREVQSLDDVPSPIFWSSLLNGWRPRWIFLPEKSEKRRLLSCHRGMPEDGVRAAIPLPGGICHNTKRRKMVPRPTEESLSHQERLGVTGLVVAMRRTSCKRAGEKEAKENDTSSGKLKLEIQELCREMDKRWANLRAADLSARNDVEGQELTRLESLENPTGAVPEEPDGTQTNASTTLINSANPCMSPVDSLLVSESRIATWTNDQVPTPSPETSIPVPPVEGSSQENSPVGLPMEQLMAIPVDSAHELICNAHIPAIVDEPRLSGSSSVKQSGNLSAALTSENPNVSSVSSPPLVFEVGPDFLRESEDDGPREDFHDASDGVLMPSVVEISQGLPSSSMLNNANQYPLGSGQGISNDVVPCDLSEASCEHLSSKEADGSDNDKPAPPVSPPLLCVPRTSDCSLFSVPEPEANISREDRNCSPQNDMLCSFPISESGEHGTQSIKDDYIPGDIVRLSQDDEQTCDIPDAIPISEFEVANHLSEEAPGNQHEEASRVHDTVSRAGSSSCIPLPNCVSDRDCSVRGSLNEVSAVGEPRQQFPANSPADLFSSGLNGLTPRQMLPQHCTDQGSRLSLEQFPAPTQPPSLGNGVMGQSLPAPRRQYLGNATCSQHLRSPAMMQSYTHLRLGPADGGTQEIAQPQVPGSTSYYLQNCSYFGVNDHVSAIMCPLQAEVERIKYAEAETVKKHDDMVLQLGSARDREMARINEKYDNMFQDALNDFTREKKELQMRLEKINAHKALAWSWRLATEENSPMNTKFNRPSVMQSPGLAPSNGVQTNAFSCPHRW